MPMNTLFLFEGAAGAQDTIRFIEEKCDVGLWSLDPRLRKMEWSPGVFRLLGLAVGSVEPSLPLLESMIHPEDVEPPGDIERTLNDGTPAERRFRLIQPSGLVRSVVNRSEVLFDQAGRLVKAIGIMSDITQMHEARNTAKEAYARYNSIAELMSALVWTARADGTVDDFPSWRGFTGQSIDDIRNEGWLNALHVEDRKRVKEAWESSVANRKQLEVEYRLRRVDGVYRWMRARAKPLFRRDGTVREWLGCVVDIHEQKIWSSSTEPVMTGAQLRAARGILKWSVRDLSEAANVSAFTIRRLEETNGPLIETSDIVDRLLKTLEGAGTEFLFPSIGKPAIRLR